MRLSKLNGSNVRRGCGLEGALLIVSIVYYALGGMWFLRHRNDRAERARVEYYSPTVGLVASQWGTRRSGGSSDCSSCSGGSCAVPVAPDYDVTGGGGTQTASASYAWDVYGPPWRLTQGGTLVGTLYANGSFIGAAGDAIPCPAGWYPTGFDVTKLKVTEKAPISVPPAASPNGIVAPVVPPEKTGDTSKPLFGVATKELDSSLQNNTASYFTTDSNGNVRAITRSDAFNSVGSPQLQSLYKGYNLAIIGVDAQARREMAEAARSVLPAGSNVTIGEYDPKNPADLWHVEGDWNHALSHRPTLASGGAVAYFTNGPQEEHKQHEVMAWTPDEVAKYTKSITTSIRPRDGIPNHDPNNAKIDQPLFAGWPFTNYQTFAGIIILAGALLLFTPKPPAIEAQ